jgi:hypothetical protein
MPRELLSAQDWAEKYEDVLVKLVEDGLASYSVGGQTFTKQNIAFYQEQYLFWKSKADLEISGSGGVSIVNQGDCGYVE